MVPRPGIDPAATYVQILSAVAEVSGTPDQRLAKLSELLVDLLHSSKGVMMHGAPAGEEVRAVGSAVSAATRLRINDELGADRSPDPLIDRFRQGDLEPTTAGRAFGGQELWQASPQCAASLELWGINQVAALPVRPGVQFIAFLIGRHGDDYDESDLELLRMVQPIVSGLTRLLEPERPPSADRRPTPLTPREHEVLRLLAAGHKASAIARRAGCSLRTVHRHLSNIYAKLGVGDRLAAVSTAHRLGLLDEGEYEGFRDDDGTIDAWRPMP